MYGKIFEEIFDSSLMNDGGQLAVYVFMSMVVLADKDGIVNYNDASLARHIGVDEDQDDEYMSILAMLESEDKHSNLPTENGRRIIRMSEVTSGEEQRGWLIVNYEYYRKKAGKLDKKEKTSDRVKRFRERKKCNAL